MCCAQDSIYVTMQVTVREMCVCVCVCKYGVQAIYITMQVWAQVCTFQRVMQLSRSLRAS